MVDNEVLENNSFPYLRSYLSSNADIDNEIHHQISSAAYGHLWRQLFEDEDIKAQTKINVYNVNFAIRSWSLDSL